MTNNWHRKMYRLDPPQDASLYSNVYDEDLKNEFWLEPGVYAGPAVELASLEVASNSLCYRLQFFDDDMVELWRGLEFFPGGTDDLTIDDEGNPDPEDGDPQRLQARAEVDGQPAFITLYLNPTDGELLVNVQIDAEEGGGGGNWGGGHTFSAPPP